MDEFLGINFILISLIIIVSTFGSCLLFSFILTRKKEEKRKSDEIGRIAKTVNSIDEKFKTTEKKETNINKLIDKKKKCESKIDRLRKSIKDKDSSIVKKNDEIKKLKDDNDSLSKKIKKYEKENKEIEHSHEVVKTKMKNTITRMRREINDIKTNFSMLLKLHEELAKKSEKIDQDLYAHITRLLSKIFSKSKTKRDTTSSWGPGI